MDGCLTRDDKEKIVVCYQENALCHDNLAKAIAPPAIETDWEGRIIAGLIGMAAGLIAINQVRR